VGVLKAKVNGVWEDISGVTTHEVAVSGTDPRAGAFKNAVLWLDTTPVTGKDGPDAQATPGEFAGMLKIWNNGQWENADYLFRSGGDMHGGAKIQFQNEADVAKINYYADTFGVGIEGGTQTLFASSRVRFRVGTPTTAGDFVTIPEVGSIDGSGFISAGRRVHVGKDQGVVNLTSGAWYRVGYAGNAGGGRFSVVAQAAGDTIHSMHGGFSCMNIGGIGYGRVVVSANCKDGTAPFNRFGISWSAGQYCLNIRANRTVSVDVGFEVTNSNGDMSPANWENDGGDFYGGCDV
jgi:hypothetical protein